MVAQGVLPFQYETERSTGSMTGFAGLAAWFELAVVAGLRDSVGRNVQARGDEQGWSDWEAVCALVMLNLVGGECVDDIDRLEGDAGLGRVMASLREAGLSRPERRRLARRWRKERRRAFPSPSALRRYLAWFHHDAEEHRRVEGQAFIPERLPALVGLTRVNADVVAFLQKHRPVDTATLDMDATLVETLKQQALFCYKKFRAYQPLNVWWAEQQSILLSEFRDGNVPAGYDQLRVLVESLSLVPEGVAQVCMRSDTAGYQWDLLRYCEEGRNERFGRIEFAVGADITDSFKRALVTTPGLRWEELGDSGQEWAEVCYVPSALGATKKGTYRFIAVREPVRQQELFEEEERQYSFPTIAASDEQGREQVWKLTAVVTNRVDTPAPEVIAWYRERCGKSEEAHAIMKHDLAGGQLPSKYFGANAAWWQAMILSLNLVTVMKHVALEDAWRNKRMKAVRLWLVAVPARVIEHARRLVLKLAGGSEVAELLIAARERIRLLANTPSG